MVKCSALSIFREAIYSPRDHLESWNLFGDETSYPCEITRICSMRKSLRHVYIGDFLLISQWLRIFVCSREGDEKQHQYHKNVELSNISKRSDLIRSLLHLYVSWSSSFRLDSHHPGSIEQRIRCWRSNTSGRCAENQSGMGCTIYSGDTFPSPCLSSDTDHSGSMGQQNRWWKSEKFRRCVESQSSRTPILLCGSILTGIASFSRSRP